MSARADAAALAPDAGAESSAWTRRGVRVPELDAALTRLHRDHQAHHHGHAAARTLNLVVAPVGESARRRVHGELERLGSHSPSRTIELREHAPDRLDAEVHVICEAPPEPGRFGACHDRVVLRCDPTRLRHVASICAPLVVEGLPTVLWRADPAVPVSDPELVTRADYVVLDSSDGPEALRAAAALAGRAPIHDVAWAHLQRSRAAVAAAWESPERRALLGSVDGLEISGAGGPGEEVLLAGWIVARAGWRQAPLEWDDGRARGTLEGPGGSRVAVELHGGSGSGRHRAVMRAGREEVAIELAGPGWPGGLDPDPFAEALAPNPRFESGYPEALAAAATMLGPG